MDVSNLVFSGGCLRGLKEMMFVALLLRFP
jgi:hypothetical protein